MKTIKFLSVLALSAFICFACKSNNNAEEPKDSAETTETTQTEAAETPEAVIIDSAKIAAGTAFLEEFYKVYDQDILNYEFIKNNITPKFKQWLVDEYDYECDGECMATWLFCYDAGADTGPLKVRTIKPEGNGYLVTCIHDQGNNEYRYSIKLNLIQDGDSFKIDSMEQIENFSPDAP